ncbi:Coq7-like demethoxyubiquinone hydroxylase family protein [Candidatus Trichorickettsia mobilis]|jgi:ubiquinone biosynthesis monooxygenase Coq7|uniref:Coq7-like demethoxyubiquinone hydroxylase family protein n=1 Tax=Candidatus Trichorickettsia mobilis TaxID=1346319 RepID=A0ABZ0UU69_9RICK|nr:demethoxyubiquinone hydroxylase family protein [Candidatus Trichorickettsia mobilis]WPY00429.1 Coq7-like demethoxyubiquinone hydroxylase family protein [Candidatus Trichorickettsia mobilis]
MPQPSFIESKSKIAEMIRVDHAGEYGAKRIYEGQIKFANKVQDKRLYAMMLVQEQKHLDYFTKELVKRRVKPTILLPFWHVGGYLLGALSSIAGTKFAMLVTQAVEEVIELHYQQQLWDLDGNAEERDLITNIEKFKLEEVEHKEIASSFQQKYETNLQQVHGDDNGVIDAIIKRICIMAINLSKKI